MAELGKPSESYVTLRNGLQEVLAEGKEEARRAVERVRVATYHEVGKRIHEHLLDGADRAEYGGFVIGKLSEDLGIGTTLLYDALKLYRTLPIFHPGGKLGWAKCRVALRLPDPAARRALVERAAKEGLSRRDIEELVQRQMSEAPPAPNDDEEDGAPLEPLRGLIDVCRAVTLDGEPGTYFDQGFLMHLPEALLHLSGTTPGWKRVVAEGPARFRIEESRRRRSRFYTYLARVRRVVDGDTLLLTITTPFGVAIPVRVRLRGMDTPEMDTVEGRRAKAFVEDALKGKDLIGVTTTKADAYGRYLADVFVPKEGEAGQAIVDEGMFLNGELVERGLARRRE